ncbi:glycosyltransferase family 2 protein [uncultured Hymenobacter sp.]|uniref:glycosyltransferase family 2 protein n=1 Tax=uncultured Hymenobacter sp. TaxID=170016 RepID=UPI0035CC518D
MVDISVWITTYNHEQFIAEAIESVLQQNTTFTYELVIGEDCSTDRTREIVVSYKEKYPDKIKLFLPEKNLGMVPMTWASYRLCTGSYVAWLDGDDYWLDSNKLQKQVVFLRDNPKFSFCFHRVKILNQDNNSLYDARHPLMHRSDDTLFIEDFIKVNNPIHALSVVHRNILTESLPKWIFELPFPDLGFYFALCQHGEAKYIRDIMGVYRVHAKGAYTGQSEYYNFVRIIEFFNIIKREISGVYRRPVNILIRYHRHKLLRFDLNNRELLKVIDHGLRLLLSA